MSYLRFIDLGTSASGKTKRWQVQSGVNTLGLIQWFAQWRKYCFFPYGETVYDDQCLFDLSNFCKNETVRHKNATHNG